jgi:hypothetical protein
VARDNVVMLGRHGLVPDFPVIDFLVGMALCRSGPTTLNGIAVQVSGWLDCQVRGVHLGGSLSNLIGRDWVELDADLYAITQNGIDAVKGVYAAMIRLLDRGQRFLDVGVFMSIMKDFERSANHEDS